MLNMNNLKHCMALLCWTSLLCNVRVDAGDTNVKTPVQKENGLSQEYDRLLKQRQAGMTQRNGAMGGPPPKGRTVSGPRNGHGGGEETQRSSEAGRTERKGSKKGNNRGSRPRPRRRRRRRRRRRPRPRPRPAPYPDPMYPEPLPEPPRPPPPFMPPPQEFRCAPVSVSDIPLSSFEEIPMGSVDSYGSALAELVLCGEVVCIAMEYMHLTGPITGLHLHSAPFGFDGPVVVDFYTVPIEDYSVEGCVVADPDLVYEMQTNVGQYYINVHTNAYPGGEIRGQLDSGFIDMAIPPMEGDEYEDPMYEDPLIEEPIPDLSCFAFGESILVASSDLPAGRGNYFSSACGNIFHYTFEVYGVNGDIDLIYLLDTANNNNVVVNLIDHITDITAVQGGFIINASVELPGDVTSAIFEDPGRFVVSIGNSANPRADLRAPMGEGSGDLIPPVMVQCQGYQSIPLVRTDGSNGGIADLSVCTYDVDKAEICLLASATTSTPVIGALLADQSVGEVLLVFEDITSNFVDNVPAIYTCSPIDDEFDAMLVEMMMNAPDSILIVLQTEMVPDGEIGALLSSGEMTTGGGGPDFPIPPPIVVEPFPPGEGGGGDMMPLPLPEPVPGPNEPFPDPPENPGPPQPPANIAAICDSTLPDFCNAANECIMACAPAACCAANDATACIGAANCFGYASCAALISCPGLTGLT